MATDNYTAITEKLTTALQAVVDGTTTRLPWHRDWHLLGSMRNGFTNRPYTGVNIILLAISALSGFNDPRWATRNQIMKHLGYTKGAGKFGKWTDKQGNPAPKGIFPEWDPKNEATCPATVTFWKFLEAEAKDDTGAIIRKADGSAVKKTIPLLKTFNVFNFGQINWPEGKEPKALDNGPEVTPEVAYKQADAVLNEYLKTASIEVRHTGDRACYNHRLDTVTLPRLKTFKTAEGYMRTKAHELVHSTGAEKRLNRNLGNTFGSPDYAREELVAELGAAFLGSDLGFSTEGELDDNHKAYLLNWIQRLNDNKYEIFTAARLAREAVALINPSVAAESEASGDESEAA